MSTDFKKLTPREVRALAEANKLDTATGALCPDYVKASLLILPSTYADDFLRFASWNPEIFPVLEVIREKPISSFLAPGANLCTALPRYRVFINGEVSEDVNEVKALWNIGSVGFLIGCAASADGLLLENGLSVRHVEEQKAMPLYETKLRTNPTGPFRGPVVVAMRPLSQTAVKEAYRLTASHRRAVGNRHSLARDAGLRRRGPYRSGRNPGLLVFARNNAGCAPLCQAAACHHRDARLPAGLRHTECRTPGTFQKRKSARLINAALSHSAGSPGGFLNPQGRTFARPQ